MSSTPLSSPERLRVLAVSADREVVELTRNVFIEAGDSIQALTDLAEGVTLAQESPPDLAFVDVTMGQRAGLALVHHVKAVAADADVYALTRPDALDAAAQAVSLGATGLIVCPPSGDELLNAANAVRSRRAAMRLKATIKREADGVRRALGYVARLAALADRDERDQVAIATGEVFREATGARVAAVYLPTAEGMTELRCVAKLGELPGALSFTDEMGLMRYARDMGLDVVPLLAGRLSIGHILLDGIGMNSDDDGISRQVMHVLAAQATTTLSLVSERERVSRGTIKDAATSAYTFAYFVDIAGREIDKAHRHSRRFALATIATSEPIHLDKTPSPAVDVAELVLSAVRDSDVLARVDDREFYLLLPETGGLGAHMCRRRVLGLQSPDAPSSKGAPLLAGVTMGVATYPHDGGDLLKLLRMAKRRADASKSSIVNVLRLGKLSLPEVVDVLLWDANIAQGKLDPLPETPRALELPIVDVLGLISAMLTQAARGGTVDVIVTQRDGLGFAAGVRAFPGASRDGVAIHTLDVRHRDGCEDLEALSVVAEHGAYALLGRVEHGRFHGVHAADPLLADLVAQRLADLAGVRLGELSTMARQILLVEPDVDALGKLAEELRARGMVVILANDVSSALSRARANHPHVIFVAATVAKRTELWEQLSADAELAEIPRLVLVRAPSSQGLPPDHATYDDIDRLVTRALEVKPTSAPPESSQGELRGDLGQVPLVDLLQLLAMNRRTGVLTVSTMLGAGELRVADGEVLDAVYRRLEGEKALYRLLGEREGTFIFAPGSPPAVARVTKGTSALLMEAMRQKDEGDRLRVELGPTGTAYVSMGAVQDEDGPRLPGDVQGALTKALTIDELIDELPAPDLEILSTLKQLLDVGLVRRVDRNSAQAPICPPEQLPVLRALLGRLAREGFPGPARVVVASTPARVHTFGHSLHGVAGCISPAEPSPGAPVPHELGSIRLGDSGELCFIGLPVVEAFAPLWSLTLPGAGALLRLDKPLSPVLEAVCQAFEIKVIVASELLSSFDEAEPSQVAQLIRMLIEQAASN